MEDIVYTEMRDGEEQAVCELVEQVFTALVAVDFEPEGVEQFFRFANPTAIAKRSRAGGFVLLARKADRLVGMLEFVPPDRIAMLFVALRRQGIARELVNRAITKARSQHPDLWHLTVHSAPDAETAYGKLGFQRCGEETLKHGIRYVPMELLLDHPPEEQA